VSEANHSFIVTNALTYFKTAASEAKYNFIVTNALAYFAAASEANYNFIVTNAPAYFDRSVRGKLKLHSNECSSLFQPQHQR
jgi:hypothetical protein